MTEADDRDYLRAQRDELARLLLKHEWAGGRDYAECPECGGARRPAACRHLSACKRK